MGTPGVAAKGTKGPPGVGIEMLFDCNTRASRRIRRNQDDFVAGWACSTLGGVREKKHKRKETEKQRLHNYVHDLYF